MIQTAAGAFSNELLLVSSSSYRIAMIIFLLHFWTDLFSRMTSYCQTFLPSKLSFRALCYVNPEKIVPWDPWSWWQKPGSVYSPTAAGARPDDHCRFTATNVNLVLCPHCRPLSVTIKQHLRAAEGLLGRRMIGTQLPQNLFLGVWHTETTKNTLMSCI